MTQVRVIGACLNPTHVVFCPNKAKHQLSGVDEQLKFMLADTKRMKFFNKRIYNLTLSHVLLVAIALNEFKYLLKKHFLDCNFFRK